ncbi:MAG TPA: sulfur carrier protein ThiS [Candidatus Dormibacteraeota bacterium]|nr:sulfur carrier protein ThiS [Candidatus Dormibacteraeota bacterium]
MLNEPRPSETRSNEAHANEIQIVVNGESRSMAGGATVADLLVALALPPGRVAIERNLEILPRPQWAETRIQPQDRYEIVQFVGGG